MLLTVFHIVVPPGIATIYQVVEYRFFSEIKKMVIFSYFFTLNLRCSAHRCMVVSYCKGSELLGTTIISVF